ncbi:hypothetical protein DFP72DRAFT_1083040 [Ephemerocybe angulata]|uniref:Uncharacterized protein n=1 Tax=Ephemerocybe angulata TaxID=980116 RepID=A0A8H6LTP5_9AGAR|nr:hypothetical protein DFP72DRAFT_1083040 [Tulosesus angulatus]
MDSSNSNRFKQSLAQLVHLSGNEWESLLSIFTHRLLQAIATLTSHVTPEIPIVWARWLEAELEFTKSVFDMAVLYTDGHIAASPAFRNIMKMYCESYTPTTHTATLREIFKPGSIFIPRTASDPPIRFQWWLKRPVSLESLGSPIDAAPMLALKNWREVYDIPLAKLPHPYLHLTAIVVDSGVMVLSHYIEALELTMAQIRGLLGRLNECMLQQEMVLSSSTQLLL